MATGADLIGLAVKTSKHPSIEVRGPIQPLANSTRHVERTIKSARPGATKVVAPEMMLN